MKTNPYMIKSWSKLSKVNKRKALAWDVIQQVKIGKIVPVEGLYTDIKIETGDTKTQLQKLETCTVCAMGSLMVCDILNRNNFKNNWSGEEIEDRFEGVFSRYQLRLIETAFEGFLVDDVNKKLSDEHFMVAKAIKFHENKYNYLDRTEGLLISIMKNILKDKNGLFLGKDEKS